MFRVSTRERIEEGGSVLIGTMSTMALVFTVCVLFSPIVNSEPECALLYFTRAVCPWTPVVSTGSEQVWWGGDSACPMACNRDSSGAPIECLASEVLLHTHNLLLHQSYTYNTRFFWEDPLRIMWIMRESVRGERTLPSRCSINRVVMRGDWSVEKYGELLNE